ncbi:MAG: hypothetical protein MZW92_02795 [Comamonadaceae bacterium]|nr:hypothetical protein [Comamonadaceae bacterium]
MWPGSDDTWYTDKYGANPYGAILDHPGQFFTSDLAKASFKNQLSYIVARWGYSDHLMAWELFNEVDWIEQYSATSGTAWHAEMAELPEHDRSLRPPGDHLGEGRLLPVSVYNVFDLEQIDYVNVHSYGIYNHTSTLPTRQKNGFLAFQKPILYAEVGMFRNGGAAQMAVDPDNVTLHQELWGRDDGRGRRDRMNWWWESWIHPSDAYHEFAGAAAFGAVMDLTGGSYALLSDVGASVSKRRLQGDRLSSRRPRLRLRLRPVLHARQPVGRDQVERLAFHPRHDAGQLYRPHLRYRDRRAPRAGDGRRRRRRPLPDELCPPSPRTPPSPPKRIPG